jgi:hypothetical protein
MKSLLLDNITEFDFSICANPKFWYNTKIKVIERFAMSEKEKQEAIKILNEKYNSLEAIK